MNLLANPIDPLEESNSELSFDKISAKGEDCDPLTALRLHELP
ncbi:hypothetical protein [uncultured Nostoc sp.]